MIRLAVRHACFCVYRPRPTLHFSYFLAVAYLNTVESISVQPVNTYIIVHHPCNPNHTILHEMCVPHTGNSMLSVPPFAPTEASLASCVVSAASYDIVSELKALLFLVTFGHFTINIVSQRCSR